MNDTSPDTDLFTSRMTRGEVIAALLYLPLHVGLIPSLLYRLPATSSLSDLTVNMVVYITGAVYMLLFLGRFLRRDFDPLIDHLGYCVLQILICYGMMVAFNLMLSGLLVLFLPSDSVNPNNSAVMEMAGVESASKYWIFNVFDSPADSFADSAAGLNVSLTCRCRKFSDT